MNDTDLLEKIKEILKVGMGEKKMPHDIDDKLCRGIAGFFNVDGVAVIKITKLDLGYMTDLATFGDDFIIENIPNILTQIADKLTLDFEDDSSELNNGDKQNIENNTH